MLSRILKGKNRFAHPDPGARRQAVEGLSPAKAEALQDELLALASSDKDPHVRMACIARLASADVVARLLNDPVSADAAARRIIELIGTDTGNRLARHPLVAKLRLLQMTPSQARPALEAIDDVELLIDLSIHARQELREVILQRLQNTTALTELEHKTRGHDKSLNRHAREGLERIRTTRHEARDTRARLVALAEALERHLRVDNDAGAKQRHTGLLREFEQASARFEALAIELCAVGESIEPVDDAQRRVAAVREQATTQQLAAKQLEQHVQDKQAREAQASPTPRQIVPNGFADLVTAFQALQESMVRGEDFAAVTEQRKLLTDAWMMAADQAQASSTEHEVFETVSNAYHELADSVTRLSREPWSGAQLQPLAETFSEDPKQLGPLWAKVAQHKRALRQGARLIETISWPNWAAPNPAYAELLRGIDRMREALARAETHEQRLKTRLEELIGALGAEIEQGALKTAFGTLNHARKLSNALPEKYVADLVKTLNRDAARLAELADWQTFATTPKREALCETIQVLVDHPVDPSDQADRIKLLRADWNALGPVTMSEDRKLADQFNALAEKAFEPCRAFFAEQAQQRKTNLAERRKICEQLQSYLDTTNWESADKKAAEKIMRAARDEWRRFHPVDRSPGRPLEERFEKLQGRLYELVKAEWDTNLKLKGAIVDEAKALLEGDANAAGSVEGAKRLQRRWREIGVTPRRPDQILWREFRAACDSIFAARDEAKQQSAQVEQDAAEMANALVVELEEVVATTTAADADERILRGFKNRFADLSLPERTRRGLQRRIDELSRSYREIVQLQQRNAERGQLDQLRRWDESVSVEEARCRVNDADDLSVPDPLFDPRLDTTEGEVPRDTLRGLTIR
ncbi:MAG: DUF349 domain-containing protein, partial [Gammaproteobacteria bacterium]|nr:DUF349 domain-containing protein [Gammaproteobacteria bacterium]